MAEVWALTIQAEAEVIKAADVEANGRAAPEQAAHDLAEVTNEEK